MGLSQVLGDILLRRGQHVLEGEVADAHNHLRGIERLGGLQGSEHRELDTWCFVSGYRDCFPLGEVADAHDHLPSDSSIACHIII